MAIGYSAASYADFKMFMANEWFKGEIYYTDQFVATDPLPIEYKFSVTAIDVGRRVLVSLYLTGSTEQKPATFATDFPAAVQLTPGSGVGFFAG
jgi:hypothetical protein